jgi:hypothetical protein
MFPYAEAVSYPPEALNSPLGARESPIGNMEVPGNIHLCQANVPTRVIHNLTHAMPPADEAARDFGTTLASNMLYTTGAGDYVRYIFPGGDDDRLNWTREMNRIKEHSAQIHRTRRAANWLNRNDTEDYQPWITRVKHFITIWGIIGVPIDIRTALNEVEQSVGVPITRWEI